MLKSVGRFDGRTEASAGTAVAGLRRTGGRLILLLRSVGRGFRGRFGNHAGAFQREGERLPNLGFFGDFNGTAALRGIGFGLEAGRIRGFELNRLGQHDDEMFSGILQFRIDLNFAGIRKSEFELELRLSGTQREVERVLIFLGLWNSFSGDGLSVRSASLHLFELRSDRQEELEIVIVQLRLRRRRSVVDDEQAHALHRAVVSLEAKNVGGDAESGDFLRDVVDIQIDGVGAGRRHLVIGNSLMDSANQVRARASCDGEAELPARVDLGAAGDIHAAGKIDENDFVSGGRLVGGAVGDGAGQGFGGGGGDG